MKPHRYLNMVYAWVIERINPDNMEGWLADLADLLPWQDPAGQAAEEIESESFMNMMAKG